MMLCKKWRLYDGIETMLCRFCFSQSQIAMMIVMLLNNVKDGFACYLVNEGTRTLEGHLIGYQ